MELTINKLIAQDIINFGMDQTSQFSYVVDLNSYLKNYDDKSKRYIIENIDDIKTAIEQNESVAELVVNKEDDNIEFDMVFYWGYLLNSLEKLVSDTAIKNNIDLDFEQVREVADNLVNKDSFNEELLNQLNHYGTEKTGVEIPL